MTMLHINRTSLLCTIILAAATPSIGAQSPTELLARHSKLTDPTGALAMVEGMRTQMTMEIASAGIMASITLAQRKPDQMVMTVDIPSVGMMRTGYDGATAWSADPMQGPRILTGAEAAAISDVASLRALLRTPDQFTTIEAAGDITVDGGAGKCVKLTWKSARVTTECFSVASGLMTESRQKQQSPMGEVEAVTHYTDYRMVGGLMLPHRMTQSAMGTQQVMTIVSVEMGALDAKLFDTPAEIAALKRK